MMIEADQAARDAEMLLPLPEGNGWIPDAQRPYALEHRPAVAAALRARDAQIASLTTAESAAAQIAARERVLMQHDIVFYGTGPAGGPVRYALVSDTFGVATAAAEEVSDNDLAAVYDAWQRWGHDGITAWVAIRRDVAPIPSAQTERYREARAALAEVKR